RSDAHAAGPPDRPRRGDHGVRIADGHEPDGRNVPEPGGRDDPRARGADALFPLRPDALSAVASVTATCRPGPSDRRPKLPGSPSWPYGIEGLYSGQFPRLGIGQDPRVESRVAPPI